MPASRVTVQIGMFVHHFSSIGIRRKVKKAIPRAGLTDPGLASLLSALPACAPLAPAPGDHPLSQDLQSGGGVGRRAPGCRQETWI